MRFIVQTEDPLYGVELRPGRPGSYLLTLVSPYMQTRDGTYFDLQGEVDDLPVGVARRMTLECRIERADKDVIVARFAGAGDRTLRLAAIDWERAAAGLARPPG